MPSPRRLNEADANFVVMGAATGAPFVPVSLTVYEKPYPDPATSEHLVEVMSRLLPAMHQRIARDPLSPALPRWEDVPGFDPADHTVVLPAPGDGTLRAVIDWAQEWGRLPLPLDRPPWRSVSFEDVTVDGVPGRLVMLSQFHHALIDGMGAARLAEHFYQWGPDGELPEMPPAVERDTSGPWERWKGGWASEGQKAKALARNTARRLRWAAANPSAGKARARELGAALQRFQAEQGKEPLSPLLRRTSDRNRFDHLRVDLDRLRAGARALGGSANDGFMAAVSIGLHRYHLEHGVRAPELRTAMAINTRKETDGHSGNEMVAAIMRLPLIDDAEAALKACQAVSRAHRDDRDVLWLMDRSRAAINRMPKKLVAPMLAQGAGSLDLTLSNVKGIPIRSWVGGVEALETIPFVIGGPAASITLLSGATHATIGIVTCPEAVTDPERLVQHLATAVEEVSALAG